MSKRSMFREQLLGSLVTTVCNGREVFRARLKLAIDSKHLLPVSTVDTSLAGFTTADKQLSLSVKAIATANGISCDTLEVSLVCNDAKLRKMFYNALTSMPIVDVVNNSNGALNCTIDAGTTGIRQDYWSMVEAAMALLRQQCADDRLARIEQHAQR